MIRGRGGGSYHEHAIHKHADYEHVMRASPSRACRPEQPAYRGAPLHLVHTAALVNVPTLKEFSR